jgi:hypothetical protein
MDACAAPGGEATPAQPRQQGRMPLRHAPAARSPAPARHYGGGLPPHQSSRGVADTSIPSRSATASWLPTRSPSSPPGSSHPLPRLLAVVRSLPQPESHRSVTPGPESHRRHLLLLPASKARRAWGCPHLRRATAPKLAMNKLCNNVQLHTKHLRCYSKKNKNTHTSKACYHTQCPTTQFEFHDLGN